MYGAKLIKYYKSICYDNVSACINKLYILINNFDYTYSTYMYETAAFLLSFRHICIRNHQDIEYDSRLHHHV